MDVGLQLVFSAYGWEGIADRQVYEEDGGTKQHAGQQQHNDRHRERWMEKCENDACYLQTNRSQ